MTVAEKPRQPRTRVIVPPGFEFQHSTTLLSTALRRGMSTDERTRLSVEMSGMASRLDADLRDGASQLRKAVRSYVVTMSGSQEGPLSGTGIRLIDVHSGRQVLELRSGEVDVAGSAEEKIGRIIEACISLAREDLAFLNEEISRMKNPGWLQSADLTRLKTILDKNSYRRCMEII